MKVKVLVGFKDKYTGKRYHPGEHIDVTQERLAEILEKGRLVEAVEDEPGEQENTEGQQDKTAMDEADTEGEPAAKESQPKAKGKKKGK